MLSNIVNADIPKVISVKKPNLFLVDPTRSTMDMGPTRKLKMVKRVYRRPKTKLANAMARGKAKARARAAARALAKAKLDATYVESRNLFEEAESDVESCAKQGNKHLYPNMKLWTWYTLKEVIISEDGTPVNVPISLEPVDENYKGYTFMEI
jgi:hypothetical protein